MASKDPEAKRPILERKAVAAVVLGNALEFYDFTIYAFLAKPIVSVIAGLRPARSA